VKPAEVEYWIRQLAEQVQEGKPVEDSRVELKAVWPDADHETARGLGGLSNAARLEPVLWAVGLDEKARAIRSAPAPELASWLPQVNKHFNGGVAPILMCNVNVSFGDAVVVGLLFNTEGAPFVVTVPSGGAIDRDVPWREGNRTRSAMRADLLRVLVPAIRTPRVDLLDATVWSSQPQGSGTADWTLVGRLYITPRSRDHLYIPKHTVSASFGWPGRDVACDKAVELFGEGQIQTTPNEVAVPSPGVVAFQATATTGADLVGRTVDLHFLLVLRTTDDHEIPVAGKLVEGKPAAGTTARALWTLAAPSQS
jgi:hypothetical protein